MKACKIEIYWQCDLMAMKKSYVACVHRQNISQYDSGEWCGPWASCLTFTFTNFFYVYSLSNSDVLSVYTCFKSKRNNSVKNVSIVPKTELDLDILKINNLYTKYHFSLCNLCKENERTLRIMGIFRSPRATTLSKLAWSYPKQNLT
jgi:hypothetical protein